MPLGGLPGSLDSNEDHLEATGDSVASEDNQMANVPSGGAAEVSSSSVSGMTIPDVAIVLVHSGET